MALTATFQSDFSSFFTAVETAQVKLRSFESGASKVEGSLNRMVDSFSGRKIISEATLMAEAIERAGGTSSLTARELQNAGAKAAEAAEKMKALGMQVSPQIDALAASVRRVEAPLTSMSVALGTIAANAAMRAAGAIKDYGVEAMLTSARVESLGSVARFMGAQSGFTAGEIDALSASLVRQGITTGQAYDTVIQMTRANMSLADATKLATVAQSLARATGENSSETLGRLIRGVQTLQVETLRNAGVVIQLDQEYIKFAATSGRTVDSLGAQEKQQIALSAVLREGERVAGVYGVTNENVGGKIQSLKRHQEEAARAMGDVLAPALRLATEASTLLLQEVQRHPTAWTAVGVSLVSVTAYIAALRLAQTVGLATTVTYGAALAKLGPIAAGVGVAFAGWEWGRLIGESTGLTDAVERLAGRVQGLTSAEIEASMANRKYIESAEGKAAALRAQGTAVESLIAKAIEKARTDALQAEADAKAIQATKDAAAARAAADREAQAATERYNAAMEELQSSGEGWKGTLAGINALVVAKVRNYLEAGVSQAALATAYHLTAVQVRAVASALAEEEKAQKAAEAAAEKAAKTKEQALLQTSRLWNEYHLGLVAQTGTTTDIQIAEIRRWSADVAAQAQKAGTFSLQFYVALETLSRQKTAAVMVDWNALRDHSRNRLEETAVKAQATYEAMVARSGEFSDATIAEFRKTADAARLAADSWGTSFGSAMTGLEQQSASTARMMTAAAQSVALSWSEAMDLVRRGQGTMSGTMQAGQDTPEARARIQASFNAGNYFGAVKNGAPDWSKIFANAPSFAAGVQNFSGGLARVHQDELLVNLAPGTDVIPAPSVSPMSGRPSVTNNYAVTVNAGAGSNTAELARLVKAALVDAARSQGQRLAAN